MTPLGTDFARRYWSHLGSDPGALEDLTLLRELSDGDEALRSATGAPLLTRPLFLSASERDALVADLAALQEMLRSIPERLYQGDVAAMCAELGFSPIQAMLVEETATDEDVLTSRADLMRGASGFSCIEFNLHSSLGGLDAGPWHAAYARLPTLGAFLAREGLAYVDPLDRVVAAVAEAARRRGYAEPAVAVVDWPGAPASQQRRVARLAALMRARGLDAFAGDAGQFSSRRDRLVCGGREVDVLYRIFDIGEVATDPRPIVPMLRAHRAGQLVLAMSFVAELVGNKGALAMLSTPRDPASFTADERALIDRVLPSTRWVGTDPRADLAEREHLVLKPVNGHSGRGVVTGADVGESEWSAALASAASEPHVLQRRVHPRPEYLPGSDGQPQPFEVNWGVFLVGTEFSGAMIRAVPFGRHALTTTSVGALIGGCYVGP
ncbi:MAG: hypothetical protein V9G08_06515 [Dermatophilaceae bacterium]